MAIGILLSGILAGLMGAAAALALGLGPLLALLAYSMIGAIGALALAVLISAGFGETPDPARRG